MLNWPFCESNHAELVIWWIESYWICHAVRVNDVSAGYVIPRKRSRYISWSSQIARQLQRINITSNDERTNIEVWIGATIIGMRQRRLPWNDYEANVFPFSSAQTRKRCLSQNGTCIHNGMCLVRKYITLIHPQTYKWKQRKTSNKWALWDPWSWPPSVSRMWGWNARGGG